MFSTLADKGNIYHLDVLGGILFSMNLADTCQSE